MYFVYVITNKNRSVLYTGVTNDMKRRMYEHKNCINEGFSKKYNLNRLVFYEMYEETESTINREKQIKAGSRQKKIDLIERMNVDWKDLYYEL